MTTTDPDPDIEQAVAAVQVMAAAEMSLRSAGRWHRPETSLMEVLGRATDEVDNCRVLAWALDPSSHHGIGHRLIAVLAAEVGIDADAEACRLATIEVEVSRDRNRSDVVISVPSASRSIVIEAKINASEGANQCARIEADWPRAHLVFLSPTGRAPRTPHAADRWHSLSWGWFVDEIDATLDSDDRNEPPELRPEVGPARTALADWLDSTRRNLR